MKMWKVKILSALLAVIMVTATACGTQQQTADDTQTSQSQQTEGENMEEYYIFELSDTVERTAVRYKNRYGIELSADLYTSKDLDKTQTYPAIVIGPPYGGVKEQGPGVYANQLAQRGFVVLAFDPSYNGESGGEPRHISSPEIFSEDFSAGVDYLGSLDYVNREQIVRLVFVEVAVLHFLQQLWILVLKQLQLLQCMTLVQWVIQWILKVVMQ